LNCPCKSYPKISENNTKSSAFLDAFCVFLTKIFFLCFTHLHRSENAEQSEMQSFIKELITQLSQISKNPIKISNGSSLETEEESVSRRHDI